jgi:hypothetical protein
MKLNQPFTRRIISPNEERVAFNTPEPVKAEVSEVPPLTPKEDDVPSLVSNKPEVPRLERASSSKKQVELKVPGEEEVEASIAMTDGEVLSPELRQAAEPEVPELQPKKSVEDVLAIPKLVVTKREPVAVDPIDIPKLDAYNTMEVVHLLIGRSPEDEEIILLQSFPERFVRTKKTEEFHASLLARVSSHYSSMVDARKYDFEERQHHHVLAPKPISALHANKGVEWMAYVLDDGKAAEADIIGYALQHSVADTVAIREINEAKLYQRDPSYVFTWALVKVKIGHDFGSYKLSELMPSL